MIEAIFEMMESDGFHIQRHHPGRLGAEVLTFKNDAGETRTVECGWTSAPTRRNYRCYLTMNADIDYDALCGLAGADGFPTFIPMNV